MFLLSVDVGSVHCLYRYSLFICVRADGCVSGFLRFKRTVTNVWCSGKVFELQGGPGKHPSSGPGLPGALTAARLSPAAMLDEDKDERVDEAALRQLTEMGFPENRAVKALRLNQYVRGHLPLPQMLGGLVLWGSPIGDIFPPQTHDRIVCDMCEFLKGHPKCTSWKSLIWAPQSVQDSLKSLHSYWELTCSDCSVNPHRAVVFWECKWKAFRGRDTGDPGSVWCHFQ